MVKFFSNRLSFGYKEAFIMGARIKQFRVSTQGKYAVIDITKKVEEIVNSCAVETGICTIHVPHATAGIIVNEYEPNIAKDYVSVFRRLLPGIQYEHNKIDDNAQAHLLSSIFGTSLTLIIDKGRILLGTWQSILLCEFDGPRERKVVVQVQG